MQYMGLNDLREKYLSFFESKEHLRMPSFPLVPQILAEWVLMQMPPGQRIVGITSPQLSQLIVDGDVNAEGFFVILQ